jgi:NAD(P)H-hydrate epimerase
VADAAGSADLVLDAAYGTGFTDRGTWRPPPLGPVPVLAVDIPSGVDGLTGAAVPGTWAAARTVTFAALKPGLVLHPGRGLAGAVEVVDIGLDVGRARAHLVEAADVLAWWPAAAPDTHKWRAACWVVAGSPGMTGAAVLASRGAQRGGAGYVRLSVPGGPPGVAGAPVEVVGVELAAEGWAEGVLEGSGRFRSLVVGPGLGRAPGMQAEVRRVVAAATVPVVVDGDGLHALRAEHLRDAAGPRVLTPHDGEFRQLTGAEPGGDRFSAARSLAATTGCVVLLKGPTTVVASPDGAALAVTEGPTTLATAGTGDVLSGVVGALLARGLGPARAAAAAAFLHGRAARRGPGQGLVAGDLPDLLPEALASLAATSDGRAR